MGNTYISLSPNTPFCTSFRRLVDQNFIANRLRILCSASGVHRCLRQNHSKRWTKRTMPARGSFDATKLAKHLSISVDRSCSTLCKGSLWPFFALRTALRHRLSSQTVQSPLDFCCSSPSHRGRCVSRCIHHRHEASDHDHPGHRNRRHNNY